jgi:hypothetical protein
MSDVMNRQLLASLAIVAALALVGAIAAQVLAVQEAFAAPKGGGCHPGKTQGPNQGWESSSKDPGPGKCFHPGQ